MDPNSEMTLSRRTPYYKNIMQGWGRGSIPLYRISNGIVISMMSDFPPMEPMLNFKSLKLDQKGTD